MMNVFFDTEFTGLHKDTTLISIGLISATGELFYAELTDFDESQCDEWVKEHILAHLILNGNYALAGQLDRDTRTKVSIGRKEFVRLELFDWLQKFDDDIQLISDVCHYDMVLLIDLLAGDALKMPGFIVPCCHDINQDLPKITPVSEKNAFDYSRELILADHGIALPHGQKHNSLYDAEVIKKIYDIIYEPVRTI